MEDAAFARKEESMEQYARVIVDISLEKLDKTFTYRVPEQLLGHLEPGMQVEIPFGKGNRLLTGYVLELTEARAPA